MGKGFVLLGAVMAAGLAWSAAEGAGSGNRMNDRLLALPAAQQAQAIGNALHRDCVGVEAFAMGVARTGRAKGAAYWSVRCQNGKSYAVEFPPNPKIRAMFVDCQQLQGSGHECFKKF
jgi:hypothetical protein